MYATKNSGNKSVLFGVNFICGEWSSCIGGFTFLAKPFIYWLFSSYIFQYTLSSIVDELQPFFFPVPPGGIVYVKPIFIFISI